MTHDMERTSNTESSHDIDEYYDDERTNEGLEENGDNSKIEDMIVKGSKRGSARQYVRSKTPRLRWTHNLHLCFIRAVERLGGQERATPKLILRLMNIRGISIAQVKSHLQMYRSKNMEEPNRGFFMDGRNHHDIYNLSQLPMLQSFIHWSSSGLRNSPHCAATTAFSGDQHGLVHGFHGLESKKLLRNYNNIHYNSSSQIISRSINGFGHEDKLFGRSSLKLLDQMMIHSTTTLNKNASNQQGQLKKLKVKALDLEYNNGDLDLGLSLKITPEDVGDQCEKGLVGEENLHDNINNNNMTLFI